MTMTLVARDDASVATGSEWRSVPVPSGCQSTTASSGVQTATITPMSSGSGGYHDLTITISVNRDTRYSGYVWLLGGYFSWSNTFPYGADSFNQNPDKFATSWAGGLALMSDGSSGMYYPAQAAPPRLWTSGCSPSRGTPGSATVFMSGPLLAARRRA